MNRTNAPGFGKHLPPLFFVLLGWMAGVAANVPLSLREWIWFWGGGLLLMYAFHRFACRWDWMRYGFMAVAVMVAFGAGSYYARARMPEPVVPARLDGAPHYLAFEVTAGLKPSKKFKRYFVRVFRADTVAVDFGALLYLPANDEDLIPGQTYGSVFGAGEIKALPVLHYPYGFDYGRYLRRHHIHRRLFAVGGGLKELAYRNPWRYVQARLRMRIRAALARHLSPENFAVASALLLGERQDLDTRTREAFIDAGVVHVLAISGMHIGILLFFLRFLFSPFRIRYKWLYHGGILAILWFYAWLTGFSPSVLRAVIMFGFFQLAWEAEREVSGLHILVLAGFVILLINPAMAGEIGFQLSFGAVAAIILFFGLFKKIYYPRNKILQYFTDLLYVSLAAQFGVVPLVLMYFHRFSLGFVVSNFVVVPLLTVVLGLGFLAIALLLFRLPADWILQGLDVMLGWMNGLIHRIAAWKIGVMKDIYFSPALAAGLFLFTLGLYLWWQRPVRRRLFWLAGGILAFQLLWLRDYDRRRHSSEWVLAEHKGKPLLLGRNGTELHIYSDTAVYRGVAAGFVREAGVRRVDTAAFPEVFRLSGRRYLLLDTVVSVAHLPRADVLILHRSPKLNLDMVLNRTGAKHLMVMPYNYAYLRRRWAQTARARGLEYTDLREVGMVRLE